MATRGEDGVYAVNGQEVLIPFIYKSTDNMMIQMLRQLDAGYSTATGEIQLFNGTTKDLSLIHIFANAFVETRVPDSEQVVER